MLASVIRPKTVYLIGIILTFIFIIAIAQHVTAVESAAPTAATHDYGDFPATYGATLFFDDGSRHQVGSLYLGATVDAEEDGRISVDSTGDPSDDGIFIASDDAWLVGTQRNISVTVTGGSGHLMGWFDWDRNNVFDVPTETVDFGTLAAGTHTVPVTVHDAFDTLSDAPLVARFRLFPTTDISAMTLRGDAANGEVEDYIWDVPVLRYYLPLIYK